MCVSACACERECLCVFEGGETGERAVEGADKIVVKMWVGARKSVCVCACLYERDKTRVLLRLLT